MGIGQAQLELKREGQWKESQYYADLCVPSNATARAIKEAYEEQTLIWHPDQHKNSIDQESAAKKFQAITESYEVLSDMEMRGRYDRGQILAGVMMFR